MKWTLLIAATLVALAASVLLGPAAVPLNSDIVWNLRAPRAVLAFLVGGALGASFAANR